MAGTDAHLAPAIVSTVPFPVACPGITLRVATGPGFAANENAICPVP